MVKLKYTDVGFTAIDTGMRREVSVQSLFIFRVYTSIARSSAVKIDLLVVLIVCLISFCLTKFAPSLPCTILLIFPGEISFDIPLMAATWTDFFHISYSPELKAEKMTPPTASFIRLNSVAVCTPDLTFGNFGFDGRPGEAFTYHPRNIT